MDKIVIKGGNKLKGEVNVSTAKNSVLPIIVASILCDEGRCIIKNAPMLEDVFVLGNVLKSISANVEINAATDEIMIDSSNMVSTEPSDDLVKKMRASFLLMGPMLARFKSFKVSFPGGCNIGTRPIDLHLKGLKALGANISQGFGYVEASTEGLVGNKIYLDFPSVGATENIMMAAVKATGETIIENAAEEPEIEDLGNFLNLMGARIRGAGTDTIRIEGVKKLSGVTYYPIYDRIEAGTFMVAAAITRSKIKVNGVNEDHLKPVIAKLSEMGAVIIVDGSSMLIDCSRELKPVDIKTMPFPGFPTDMQAQMMGLLSTVKGTSNISETIFESRYMHASEMKRMGANIKIDGRTAVMEGVDKLTGCEVKATDLRAGAALILCGLAAEGITEVTDVYHVDRGYVDIEKKFKGLGADMERIVI